MTSDTKIRKPRKGDTLTTTNPGWSAWVGIRAIRAMHGEMVKSGDWVVTRCGQCGQLIESCDCEGVEYYE